MRTKDYIILIGIVLTFSLFLKFCNNKSTEFITKIDTLKIVKYKDKLRIDTVFEPKFNFIKQKIYLHDTILKIDTVEEIVYKYYSKNVYIDTILHDKRGLIVICDTIQQNKIKARRSDILLFEKTKIIQPKSNNFFIGVGSMLNKEINLNLNVGFRHKKHLVTVGYGTNKTILFNYQYKIK